LSVWINGRRSRTLSYRDRGLQYGDGVFETMKVRRRGIRLLDLHLDRLLRSCRRLKIQAPQPLLLRRELERIAAGRKEGVLKLMVTRGSGPRGYRPSGRERATRIVTLEPLPPAISAEAAKAVRLRVCTTRLSTSPSLAGLKTLNRLDSVLARSECIRWEDLQSAEEVFMSNAVVGIRSVRTIECTRFGKLRFECWDTAAQLRSMLDRQ